MAGFSYITLPQNINVGRALRKMMSLVKALLKLPKPPTSSSRASRPCTRWAAPTSCWTTPANTTLRATLLSEPAC